MRVAVGVVEGTPRPVGAMKIRLDQAGVKPAFDPAKVGATFYTRENLLKGQE